MKVYQLIVALQMMPPDAEVYTEGCDCIGDTGNVEINDVGDVIIGRGKPAEVKPVQPKKDPLEGVPHELRP